MTRAMILVCALLSALVGAGWAGWSLRGNEVDELKRTHAEEGQAAVLAALKAHAVKTHRIQEAQDAEFVRRTAAESDARRAGTAAAGLRAELAATRAAFEDGAAEAARSRASAAATVAMLADLLGQCSERRRELARFADEAASAGRLCERAADALILEPK